ncbi:Origin recognition complex subunit 2 [Microbotryomycetes sp. JL221]|nr:Origin recognition complex subunit 2 [Microbotryomycetes sp. JL221]
MTRAGTSKRTPTRTHKRVKSTRDETQSPTKRVKQGDDSLTRRVAHRVQRATRTHDSDSDDLHSQHEDQDEHEEDEDDQDDVNPLIDSQPTQHFVQASAGDRYLLQSHAVQKTSDELITNLITTQFTPSTYLNLLSTSDQHPNLSQRRQSLLTLEQSFVKSFAKWFWFLSQGFNVCLNGLGSKFNVLNKFAQQSKSKGHVITIKGFDPQLTMFDIVESIELVLATETRPSSSTTTTTKTRATQHSSSTSAIESRFRKLVTLIQQRRSSTSSPPLILVIHNLDGPTLRLTKNLNLLTMLSSQPDVHLICSIDHVNSGLLLSTSTLSTRPHFQKNSSLSKQQPQQPSSSSMMGVPSIQSFNFTFQKINTFLPYTIESLNTDQLFKLFSNLIFPSMFNLFQQDSKLIESSTLHVVASVTERSKNLFKLLCKLCFDKWIDQEEEQQQQDDDDDDDDDEDDGHEKRKRKQTRNTMNRINLNPNQGQPSPTIAIKLDQFKQIATDRLLASNQDQIEGLLSEFKDHNLIKSSFVRPVFQQEQQQQQQQQEQEEEEEGDEGEWIWVPMFKSSLETLLDQI